MVGQVVPLRQRGQPAVALQEGERRDRLEDRGPDGVVVDRAGHHGDQRLARAELRGRHVLDVQRLPRVLLPAGPALEHPDLVLVDGDAAVVVGHRAAPRSPSGRRHRPGSPRGCPSRLPPGSGGSGWPRMLLAGNQERSTQGAAPVSPPWDRPPRAPGRPGPAGRAAGRTAGTPGGRRSGDQPKRRAMPAQTPAIIRPLRGRTRSVMSRPYVRAEAPCAQWSGAASTSSTRTPIASFGCTKLTREPAVPRRGSSYSSRTPRARSSADAASMSSTP